MFERAVRAAAITVFAYGTVVHAYDFLTRGIDAYADFPGWLAGFYTVLIGLDATSALLIWARRRVGLALGSAVLIADALANGYAIYVLDFDSGLARFGQAVVTALAVGLVLASHRLWRTYR
ncbi:hypothetical protein [Kribbella sp. NPDC055071]